MNNLYFLLTNQLKCEKSDKFDKTKYFGIYIIEISYAGFERVSVRLLKRPLSLLNVTDCAIEDLTVDALK